MLLYHISEDVMFNKKLYPRIPDNHMTKIGAEENKTPRVCFSESIDGALIALGQNLRGKRLYVYVADLKGQRVVTNREIVDKGFVPDAKITGETWVLDPVRIKLITSIVVHEADKEYEYSYKTHNKDTANKAFVYSWNYTERKLPGVFFLN